MGISIYVFIYLSIHNQVDHLHVQVRPAVPVREAGQDKQDGGPRAGGADRGAADTRYIYLVPII